MLIFIEGRLRWNEWPDKNNPNQKQQKLFVVADNIEFMEPRAEGGMGGGGGMDSMSEQPVSRAPRASAPPQQTRRSQPPAPSYPSSNGFDEPEPESLDAPEEGDHIPF
jgi:single-strand DNA-binding protein